MRRIQVAVTFAAAAAIAAWDSAAAMPPFAQAYATNCTTCHTQVPALNSYGRYVQRTAYAALDRKTLKRSLPLWVGFSPQFDTQTSPKLQTGNLALHAVGGIADAWTYHIQQWLTQNNVPGTLDTAWFAYNDLLHRNGHLFAGKVESPAPSPFSQWLDLAPFAVAQMTVGEHQYQLANNRWGTRFDYVHKSVDAEVSWLFSNQGIGGTSEFSNATEKTLQWKLAYANSDHPTEVGLYGSAGGFPLPEGGTDWYRSVALYAQRDPKFGVPGVLAIYQRTYDANPGAGASAAAGTGTTLELYRPLFANQIVLSARKELTNDGLGTIVQSGNVDVDWHVVRFVHVYLETYMAQHSKPGYRYMIWWTTPLKAVR